MIGGHRVVGIILARGGSKRVPRKNVRLLGGKPMIAWTVEAGLSSKIIDRMVLSSDDDDIMEAARAAGCEVPFRRPDHLADDEASSVDALLHALNELDVHDGYFVLLQPTSPLRLATDIDDCIVKCYDAGGPVCASVTALEHPANWLVALDENGRIEKSMMAEDRKLYSPNGSVYVAEVAWFRENRQFWVEGVTVACETPAIRALDIDTEEDFLMAQLMVR